jgi:hypothetical protein
MAEAAPKDGLTARWQYVDESLVRGPAQRNEPITLATCQSWIEGLDEKFAFAESESADPSAPIAQSSKLENLLSELNKSPEDPLRLALRVRGEVEASHFFQRGNGQVARWTADWVLLRAGLPPLFPADSSLENRANDFETQVAQARLGARIWISRVEGCLRRYETEDFEALQDTPCAL